MKLKSYDIASIINQSDFDASKINEMLENLQIVNDSPVTTESL